MTWGDLAILKGTLAFGIVYLARRWWYLIIATSDGGQGTLGWPKGQAPLWLTGHWCTTSTSAFNGIM